MHRELQNLIEEIANSWPINDDVYPELKDKKLGCRSLFASEHIQLHLCGTMGKIASIIEPKDHAGGIVNRFQLTRLIAKSFVEILRMAEINGFDASSLILGEDLQGTMNFWSEKAPITPEIYIALKNIEQDNLKHKEFLIAFNRARQAMGDLDRILEMRYVTNNITWFNAKQPILNIFIAILRMADIHGYNAQTLIETSSEKIYLSKRKATRDD
ncbi:MAG: hypothetical protein FJZ43_01725 [Candidatus Staskawiczbacteria bacterium]|nr:hypothetical protein [Candidatus Staskawiczbacteria bacterium]